MTEYLLCTESAVPFPAVNIHDMYLRLFALSAILSFYNPGIANYIDTLFTL